jgi:putative sterol carrier protein
MTAEEQAQVQVRLLDGEASSGLALMTMQYLEQTLADDPAKQRQARKLRGRLGLEATDGEVIITISFRGNEIEIQDGAVPPLDAYIAGPYLSLVDLMGGRANPVMEHLRGRLRVRSSLRYPFLPYRVYGLLKLSPAEAEARASKWLWVALTLAGFSLGIMLAFILRRSLIEGGR